MRPLLCCLFLIAGHAAAEPEFPLTADSKPQPGVSKGTLIKGSYVARKDSVFPGTEREYQLYLPAGFDRTQPTAFMVFQDGVIFQAPAVFDNLIAQKVIPPLVGVFIKPGVVPAANDNALPRFNRSYEYDSITDTYSRFLLDEFLPALEQRHDLKFSSDPNRSAIAGSSSGGICAFMVAWHRPDRFRRVFTGVGTYVGIHGADQLPVLVRKLEPKPLRVFLQSGTGDNNLYCGDWWMANQMMERSFTWAGYEVRHAWGEGGHNQKHSSQVFPEAMRWLWHNWPTEIEVKANPQGESKWRGYDILEAQSEWTPHANLAARYLRVDAEGAVTASDEANVRTVDQKGRRYDSSASQKVGFTTLSPDQTLLYGSTPTSRLIQSQQIDASGNLRHAQPFFRLQPDTEDRVEAGGLCVDADGRLYVATSLGIQVCDQAGRVNFIIPTPKQPHDVCFGGKDLNVLFIACGDMIYKRPTKVRGVVSAKQPPIKPAPPRL